MEKYKTIVNIDNSDINDVADLFLQMVKAILETIPSGSKAAGELLYTLTDF